MVGRRSLGSWLVGVHGESEFGGGQGIVLWTLCTVETIDTGRGQAAVLVLAQACMYRLVHLRDVELG